MQNLLTKIKQHKVVIAISTLAIIGFVVLIIVGICSEIAEIKTISFFILLEILLLFIIWVISQLLYKFQSVRIYLYNSFSNFILGLHLVAGMLVLGVYYTI
ncbi:MAG: hypothetical protein FWG85_01650 [Bacteroidetes bacterium]|nr:hypothetical protein [Bacteroidota bacterium]